MLSRSRVSAMPRFTRLVASCCRAASVNRSRISGCDTLTDNPDWSSGLYAFRKLLLSVCVALHATLYDVPNQGSRWLTPAFDVTTSLCVGVGIRKPAGGC